jgi:hypothetical protein
MASIQALTVAISASRTGPGRSSNSTAPLMKMQPEQGAQARQAAGLLHGRLEHVAFEAGVVFAHHRHLQFVARAKVGKHARLAHAHDVGQRADGQAFEPDLRGHAQGSVNNGRLGLLALRQHTRPPCTGRGGGLRRWGGGVRHGQ